MTKKVFSLALALCMALALLPAAAFAADSDFTIVDGVLTEYNGDGGDVVIPDGVTSIKDSAFKGCTSLTSVTIPDSVVEIYWEAFSDCTSLTSVTIPGSVTEIYWETFSGCTSLTSVTILNGVTYIGASVFKGCTNLTSVTIPNSVVNIGPSAFEGCTSLTSMTIPDSVTEIGTYAFKDCTSLASVTIPDGVTEIGWGAFSGCTSLTSVTIPDGDTRIYQEAFSGCTSLTSVTFLGRFAFIGDFVFSGCTSLTDVYYGGSEAQWSAIDFGDNNENLLNAAVHYNSAMPDATVTPAVSAVGGFDDVKSDAYYADAVLWAVEEEITSGTGENAFSPDNVCSHVEIVALLWGAEGQPAAAAQAPFTVASYFTDAVNWAYETGVIDDDFDPSAPCTRADTVNYMWKAAGAPEAGANSFPDVPDGAPYAQAVSWAVNRDITQGDDDGNFLPGLTCTRGQIVTFLYRAYA